MEKYYIYLLFVLVFIGCSDSKSTNPALIEASAEYKLAKQKSDLDAIFLSLTKLESHGKLTNEQSQEYSKVKKAMTLLEDTRRFHSDHDHENVVLSSHELLKLYPENSEVRKMFVESGNIFNALEKAQLCLSTAFPNGAILQKVDDNGTESTDLVKVTNLMIDASKFVDNANSLDPNFVTTQEMKKNLDGSKKLICLLLSQKIYQNAKVSVVLADYMARTVYNALIEIRDVYPSGFNLQKSWDSFAPNVKDSKIRIEEFLSLISETQIILRDISDESNLYKAIKDLRSETTEIVDMLLDPTGGNLSDWSRNIDSAKKRWARTTTNLNSSMPNEERINEDVISLAKLWQEMHLYKNSKTAALIK